MVKKNPMKRVYWMQSSKLKVSPWQKCMIPESRNLLRTILSLKHEQIIKKREAKIDAIEQNDKFKEQNCPEKIYEYSLSESSEGFGLHEPKNIPKIIKSNQANTNQMRDLNKSEEQLLEFPQIFTKLLKNVVKRAKNIKDRLKIERGLPLEKQFIPENFHICQYCKKKFLKPCSLGGHISKLHSEERKKEKQQIEVPQWEYQTPVRRK